jgi:hypothetical protein
MTEVTLPEGQCFGCAPHWNVKIDGTSRLDHFRPVICVDQGRLAEVGGGLERQLEVRVGLLCLCSQLCEELDQLMCGVVLDCLVALYVKVQTVSTKCD